MIGAKGRLVLYAHRRVQVVLGQSLACLQGSALVALAIVRHGALVQVSPAPSHATMVVLDLVIGRQRRCGCLYRPLHIKPLLEALQILAELILDGQVR